MISVCRSYMAVNAVLTLLLFLHLTFSVRPRSRSNLHEGYYNGTHFVCEYNESSDALTSPAIFVNNLVTEVNAAKISYVSDPRKRITYQLTMAAIKLKEIGDIVETGVYLGGTAAVIARTLFDFDRCGRKFWAFDSFAGLPQPTDVDRRGKNKVGWAGEFKASLEAFKQNMRRFGVWDKTRVIVVPGWFDKTIQLAPIRKIVFLRLDGDLYKSTYDVLKGLYDKVIPGGYIYIDDYGSFNGCKAAVNRFRTERSIQSPMVIVYEDNLNTTYEAVWWQKGL